MIFVQKSIKKSGPTGPDFTVSPSQRMYRKYR